VAVTTLERIHESLAVIVAIVLIAFIPLMFYAGFRDAGFVASLATGNHQNYLTQFVFARCSDPAHCEFVYRVKGVDLLLADFGQEKVRAPAVTKRQELLTQDLHELTTFWTEQSSVAKAVEGIGLFKLLSESIKKSRDFEEVKAKSKGFIEEAPVARIAILAALSAGAYGAGFFVAEHWFPAGPGSAKQVALAKAHLATPDFQQVVLHVNSIFMKDASRRFASDNVAPKGCDGGPASHAYPPDFATDETFSGAAMTLPCGRAEFAEMVDLLAKRDTVIRANGRPLRLVDVRMIAGVQAYAAAQDRIHPPPEPESSWTQIIVGVGIVVAIFAVGGALLMVFWGVRRAFATR
jgi:hypothetical protein